MKNLVNLTITIVPKTIDFTTFSQSQQMFPSGSLTTIFKSNVCYHKIANPKPFYDTIRQEVIKMFNIVLDELLTKYDNMMCEQFCKYRENCDAISDGACALSVAAEKILIDFAKDIVEQELS